MSDLLTIGAMFLFAGCIVLLAEVNDRWQRKGYMYGKNTHSKCKCSHPGYEHSYRTGVCRFEAILGGTLFRCPCSAFRENSEELV